MTDSRNEQQPETEAPTTPEHVTSAPDTTAAATPEPEPEPEANVQPKITAKVGGKEKSEHKNDNKKRLDKELHDLKKKLHDLHNKPKDQINSPEDAYKLFAIGTDIAEGLKLRFKISKVENLIQRYQQKDMTPEAKQRLDDDAEYYFKSPREKHMEKGEAIGKHYGGYAGPLGGLLGGFVGRTLGNIYGMGSVAANKIGSAKDSLYNLVSKPRSPKPIEPDENQPTNNTQAADDNETPRGPGN